MERLTIRNSEGIGVLKHPYQCERCGDLQWSLPDLGNGSPTERLAEYEDIGLTPEQLIEVDRLYAGKCKELAELEKKSFSGIEMVKIWAKLKKLKEYEDLEKQGKLEKIPCMNEEKYTVEQIIDAITQASYDIIYAMQTQDRERLEDVLKDYLHC